ncbi:MAG: hypothetical protein LBD43_01985 [Holosporales bacterium]|jgi:hypothetical protein|nr:hypothetical protein [Holosporales bacterium]
MSNLTINAEKLFSPAINSNRIPYMDHTNVLHELSVKGVDAAVQSFAEASDIPAFIVIKVEGE